MRGRVESAAIDPARLRDCVDDLAGAIARGECTPDRVDLLTLAAMCRDLGLHAEAARIRSWIGCPPHPPRVT